MGKEYGKDWRVEIGDGATPTEAFTPIGGEVSFDWSRSSKEIDLSSKDDGQYAATGYGQQSVQVSVNGKVSLPDTGLEAASDLAKAATPVGNMRIVKGAIVKYEGAMAIGNFSTTHPNDEVCTWKFDLKSAAAPTVDDLGAAA
jgi:predicted secreted protein